MPQNINFLSENKDDNNTNSGINTEKSNITKTGFDYKVVQNEKGKATNSGFLAKLKNLRKGGSVDKNEKNVDFIGSEIIIPPAKELANKASIICIMLLICIVAVILIYISLIVKEKFSLNEIEKLQNQKTQVEKEISGLEGVQDKIIDLNDNITVAAKLLDNHVYWDKFFKGIKEHTLKDVNYTTININSNGQFKADALTKNFDALSEQIKIFKANPRFFNSFDISGIRLDFDQVTGKIGGVRFFVSLSLDDQIFKNPN